MAIDWDQLVVGPCHAIFGEPAGSVTYQPQTGAAFTLEGGVFDAIALDVNPLTGLPVSSEQPALMVRLALFPEGIAPLPGDQLMITGALPQRLYGASSKAFRVKDVQPDSLGGASLLLNEAQ